MTALSEIEAFLRAVPLLSCGHCYACLYGTGRCADPRPDYPAMAAVVREAWERERKLVQALADEKCKWFLDRADAAEARVKELERGIRMLTAERDALRAYILQSGGSVSLLGWLAKHGKAEWEAKNRVVIAARDHVRSGCPILHHEFIDAVAALAEPPQEKEEAP